MTLKDFSKFVKMKLALVTTAIIVLVGVQPLMFT